MLILECDERRPICTRCEKGSRECSYPPASAPKKSRKAKASPAKEVDPGTGSEESVEEFDDFGEEMSSSSAVVKFSSALSPRSSSDSSDPFEILQLDDQMLIDSLTPPSFPMEPLFSPPPLSFSTISGNTPSAYCQSLQLHMNSTPSAWSPESYSIPEELSWRTGHYPDKVEALIGRLI